MSRYASSSRRNGTPPLFDILAAAESVAATCSLTTTTAPPPPPSGPLLDARGRRRTPATMPGARRGCTPANKGKHYKPTPPSVAECMAMLRNCPPTPYGRRLYAGIALLWQGALRSFEALALVEADLNEEIGSIDIRCGKGGKAATITMAQWAWPLLAEWREIRRTLPDPTGPLLCVIDPPTAGRAWSYPDLRRRLRDVADVAGVRRRAAPHQLRHAWTVHAHADGVDPYTMMLHLRHANLGVTDTYLKGLGIDRAHERVYRQPVPTVPATVLLELTRERPR